MAVLVLQPIPTILWEMVREENVDDLNEMEIRKVAMIYEGEREQKYPKYSSKIQGWENYSLASDSSQFSRKILYINCKLIN